MNRDEILSSFQAISNILDFDECLQILQSVDWDLQKALDSAESNNPPPGASFPLHASVSTETPPVSNDLTFNVSYETENFIVSIMANKTIGDLQKAVSERVKNNNILLDMNLFDQLYDDNTVLAHLNVQSYHSITATKIATPESSTRISSTSSVRSQEYKLTIRMHINGTFKQCLRLDFPGKTTIATVKSHVVQIAKSDKSQHKWTGWPSNVLGSEVTLEESGLTKEATLLVDIIDNTPNLSAAANNDGIAKVPISEMTTSKNYEMDADDDEYDDYDNDVMDFDDSNLAMASSSSVGIGSKGNKKPSLLEPDAYKDQLSGTIDFVHEFNRRYFNDKLACQNGASSKANADADSQHRLPFFAGTLNDAVRETLNKQPTERTPLFVYIHNGTSIQANIFCSQILCNRNICLYFNNNHYKIWPWDITYSDNKKNFMLWFTQLFGNNFVSRIRIIPDDEYPVLIAIGKTQSVYEMLGMYDNKKTHVETLDRLLELQTRFLESQLPDIAAWEEREHRALVKQEQDEAYQQSLLMDQAKEQKRDAEEKARIEAEMAKILEAKRAEKERKSRIDKAVKKLPTEPSSDVPESDIVIVKLRTPVGSTTVPDQASLTRKFLLSHKLFHLIAFMESLGFFTSEYKLVMTYPRKNLTEISDTSVSLKKVGLMKRENLIIESI